MEGKLGQFVEPFFKSWSSMSLGLVFEWRLDQQETNSLLPKTTSSVLRWKDASKLLEFEMVVWKETFSCIHEASPKQHESSKRTSTLFNCSSWFVQRFAWVISQIGKAIQPQHLAFHTVKVYHCIPLAVGSMSKANDHAARVTEGEECNKQTLSKTETWPSYFRYFQTGHFSLSLRSLIYLIKRKV